MADILDDNGVQTSPVDINDLVTVNPLPADPPPVEATRNSAAITSMISNPFQTQDNYNAIQTEAQQGQTTTRDLLQSSAKATAKEQDQGTLMGLLADPTVPHEQKQSAIDNWQTQRSLYDTSNILHTNLLSKPAAQESTDAEQARISVANEILQLDRSRAAIQVMQNSLKEKVDEESPWTTFWDHAAGLIPFRNAIVQDKVYSQMAAESGVPVTVWNRLQSYLQNGTRTVEMRAYVNSLPPEQQEQVAKSLYKAVQNKSGFLFGNDNHHKAYEEFSKVFSADGYGRGGEFIDNFAGLLDLVTAGSTIKDIALAGANIGRMVKGGSGLLNQAEKDAFAKSYAGKVIPSTNRTEPVLADGSILVTGQPSVSQGEVDTLLNSIGVRSQQATKDALQSKVNSPIPNNVVQPMVPNPQVTALQNERSGLLEQAGNAAQKGGPSLDTAIAEAEARQIPDVKELTAANQAKGMKFKEAKAAAQKTVDDALADQQSTLGNLRNQKNAQVEGAKATQRIGEIDQQIKNLPSHVPAKKRVISEAVSDTMDRLSQGNAVHRPNSNSPMEIAQNANPESARQLHKAVVAGDDEVAHALTGNAPEQAIADAVLPQHSNTGTVFSRTADIDRVLRQDSQGDGSLVNLVDQTSVNAFSPEEAAAARGRVVNDFHNANGLVHNDSMSHFSFDGNRITTSQVYESAGGSWSKAEDAVEQARYALRQYGITDDNITVLRKNGVNHEPVDLDAVRGIPGDYKIKVDTNFELPSRVNIDNPEGSFWSNFDVKRNWFDRFAGTHAKDRGSLQRYVIDAASALHQVLTGSASVAKDYGARFEQVMMKKAEDFARSVKAMSPGRQQAINDYIREANFKGIAFDQSDLAARGFNANEVDALRKWRSFWDDHYYLENLDVVRSLRNQGYELFENSNARLFAKPIGRATNVSSFYDPATDSVRSFAKGELDDLYNKGGTIARLRRPATFNGVQAEYMISRQTANEYTRALNDADKALNKREGYFTLTYKAAKFVDELDASGKKVRTVAVAGDQKEAEQFVRRQQQNNPGVVYKVRNDDRGYRYNTDEHWDVESANGRIAQRHRGQLLQDASGLNHIGDMSYIEHPALSAERAARSIAGRTVMRNVIDTGVERFLKQYERVLPRDQYGNTRFPQSAAEIGLAGERSSKEVADARTTWEYLNWLRSGYINSLNDGYKAVLNHLADVAGDKSAFLERGLRKAAGVDIANAPRKTVFAAYLATNPLRQVFTQAVQAWRIAAYNPKGLLNGKVGKLISEYYGEHTGITSKTTEFTKFMDESGFTEAVKHHNLGGSVLNTLADEGNVVTRGFNNVVGLSRRIGFDNGELASIVAHSAAVFDRYKSLGRDLKNKDVVQRMHDEIRALTYDMNAAGDMPYNQGAASTLLQFMQMPHKALLNYTNRRIDPAVRARMLVGDMLLWGAGIDKVADALGFDILPGNDTTGKKILKDGIVATLYNHTLQKLFPNTHDVDFSALDPRQLDGWSKLFAAAATGGLMPLFKNSPAGSLFANRFGDVFKQMSSIFTPMPYDNRNTPEKFLDIVNSVAKLSSGWNNIVKAKLMMQAGEQRDKYGSLIDEKTTTGDAIAQAFGFQSKEQAQSYDLSQRLSQESKANKDDVLKHYNDIKKFYADQYSGGRTPDVERMTQIASAAMMVYENDPVALGIIQKQFAYDAAGKDAELAKQMMRSFNLPGSSDYLTKIDQGPWDDQTKAQMKQALDFAKNAQTLLDQQEGQ